MRVSPTDEWERRRSISSTMKTAFLAMKSTTMMSTWAEEEEEVRGSEDLALRALPTATVVDETPNNFGETKQTSAVAAVEESPKEQARAWGRRDETNNVKTAVAVAVEEEEVSVASVPQRRQTWMARARVNVP